MPERFRIGVDLGGTKTEVVLLGPEGEQILRKRLPTPRDDGYDAILDTIVRLIDEARQLAREPCLIGMGIPGIIDPGPGTVINANTRVLIGNPLRDDLIRRIGQPLRIENDANCFTLAETRAGAATGYDCVFGIIMGTGCGGGLFINGQVREGRHGITGEWGHFSISPDGPECWCGNRGCIETLISGSGLERRYSEATGERMAGPAVIDAARRGKPDACRIFDAFLDDFGRALGGIISVLDPDAVVIGGGLSNVDELYTEGLARVRKYVFHPDIQTPILKNRLGDSAGVFGAAWIGI